MAFLHPFLSLWGTRLHALENDPSADDSVTDGACLVLGHARVKGVGKGRDDRVEKTHVLASEFQSDVGTTKVEARAKDLTSIRA